VLQRLAELRRYRFVFIAVTLITVSGAAVAAPSISTVTPSLVANGSPTLITVGGTGFLPGAQILVDGTAVATTYVSATQIKATIQTQPSPGGMTGIRVSNAANDVSGPFLIKNEAANAQISYGAAARFLEQAAFGPDPISIERVQRLGMAAFLNEQFAMKVSTYPNSTDKTPSLGPVQHRFFVNITTGTDQLRQRVAFALSQIFVVSGYKTSSPQQMMPYLQLLHDHAFSNYGTLLRAVTLSPTMGLYLDMVNNVRTNPISGTAPNENFAREVLQLFTIGPEQLNLDGSIRLAAGGKPIPTYTQETIAALARVFTGWTYAPAPGAVSKMPNPQNFNAPMQPIESSHDTNAKVLLNGVTLLAGQTATKDLDDAINNIFQHPNAGPFLAKRLIKTLVTSNPSPAYVQRAAQVFNNSAGVRGDLRAVIRAILLDPEARAGDPPNTPAPGFGHLREPVLYIAATIRAMGGSARTPSILAGNTSQMDQLVFYPRSVFGYYSHGYTIPGTSVGGPEFQIFYPSSAIARANFVHAFAMGASAISINLDLSKLQALGGSPDALLEVLSRAYLRGQMSTSMKDIIRPAILAYSPSLSLLRAQNALYLTVSSPLFEVQR
jgi:hypothetical protein